jgi:hypothetical protein
MKQDKVVQVGPLRNVPALNQGGRYVIRSKGKVEGGYVLASKSSHFYPAVTIGRRRSGLVCLLYGPVRWKLHMYICLITTTTQKIGDESLAGGVDQVENSVTSRRGIAEDGLHALASGSRQLG